MEGRGRLAQDALDPFGSMTGRRSVAPHLLGVRSPRPGPQATEQSGACPPHAPPPTPRTVGQARSITGSDLGNDGQLRAEVVEADVCHVEVVDADFTLRRLQDAEQAQGHG